MALKFTARIPGGIDRNKFMAEIKNQMQLEGRLISKTYERFVDTWEEKPKFKVETTETGNKITTTISPAADEGLLQIMRWVIYGTKGPYTIPRRPGPPYPLRYPAIYTPKTQPGIIQSIHGGYGAGEQVVIWSVEHPGIEARDTINLIYEIWQDAFREDMSKATGAALTKASKPERKI